MHVNDCAMLEAALPFYDARYAWRQSAQGENHGRIPP